MVLFGFLVGLVSCTGCALGQQAAEKSTTLFGPDMRHANLNRLYNSQDIFWVFHTKGIFVRELNYEFRVHLEMCKFNFRKASVQLWTANAQGRFIFNCLLCRKLSVLGAH